MISSSGKFIEKVVSHQVVSFFNVNSLLYDNQFGFRKGHSTTHLLIKFTEYAHAAISGAEGRYSAIIFIDLKKAIDTVPYDLLLKKLNFYGVRGTANLWFKSYLNGRSQITDVCGAFSSPLPVQMGVPQGSVLGPLLFLIYINDLYRATSLKTLLFADDMTMQHNSFCLRNLFTKINSELKMQKIGLPPIN